MRNLVRATMLVLVLALSASAGEMQNPVAPTPPQPTGVMQNPTDDGEMQNPLLAVATQVGFSLLSLL